jgi:lysophospholipase-2
MRAYTARTYVSILASAAASTCSAANKMKAGVVFMHGLGDTPAGWSDLKQQLARFDARLKSPEIEWTFPAAPIIPLTINDGATMPGWFDLFDWPIGPDAKDDRARVLEGVEAVRKQIAKLEASGVPPERIVVGGFSQGGAVALNAAYRHDKKLGACVALSGWLTLKEDFAGDLGPAASTPLFWGHGVQDDKVLFPLQKIGVGLLTQRGVKVDASQYPIGHGAHPDEMAKLAKFVGDILFPDS